MQINKPQDSTQAKIMRDVVDKHKTRDDKQEERLAMRRLVYANAMEDMKLLRDFYRLTLHKKLQAKVELQRKKRWENDLLQSKHCKEPIEKPKKRLWKSNNMNDNSKPPLSRRARIVLAYHMLEKQGIFHCSYDADLIWNLLNKSKTLNEIEKYLATGNELTLVQVKSLLGFPPDENTKRKQITDSEKSKISSPKKSPNKQSPKSEISTHNQESKFLPRVQFPIVSSDLPGMRKVSGKAELQHQRLSTRSMYETSCKYEEVSRKLLSKLDLLDLNGSSSDLKNFTTVSDFVSPGVLLPNVQQKSQSFFHPVEEKLKYEETASPVKLSRNTKYSRRWQRIPQSCSIIQPLCLEDLESSYPIKSSNVTSSLWKNPVLAK